MTCQGWSHGSDFQLAIRPSPNFPSTAAIDLYPSLCLFEPTDVSVGRGTPRPLSCSGIRAGSWALLHSPQSPPLARRPTPNTKTPCVGTALDRARPVVAHRIKCRRWTAPTGLHARSRSNVGPAMDGAPWVVGRVHRVSPSFFDKLAGTDALRLALEAGTPLDRVGSHLGEPACGVLRSRPTTSPVPLERPPARTLTLRCIFRTENMRLTLHATCPSSPHSVL